MSIKKYTNGSWTPDCRKYGTETDAITTLPATIIGDGTPITSYTIKGNMEQNGTPTPSSPIYPSECGEKTENIMDVYSSYGNKVIKYGGVIFDFSKEPQCITINGQANSMYPQVQIWGENGVLHFENGKTYTALIKTTNKPKNSNVYMLIQGRDAEDNWPTIANISSDMGGISFSVSKDYVDFRNIFVCQNTGITYDNMKAYFMLTADSTAPTSYIPYGYKLPLTLGSTTTDIYLGEVQSTRRVKKLVFDGTETIAEESANVYSIPITDAVTMGVGLSTHFVYDNSISDGQFRVEAEKVVFGYNDTLANFSTFLAAQYAEGTPVTIWYVLAEPETAVVNEPIRKIGDYVDSISGTGLATSGTAQGFDVGTALKPSEANLTYHGWHEHEDTKYST